jgi:hypothetical protein
MEKEAFWPIVLGTLAMLGLQAKGDSDRTKALLAQQKQELDALRNEATSNTFENNKFTIGGGIAGAMFAPKIVTNIDPMIASIGGGILGSLIGHKIDKGNI